MKRFLIITTFAATLFFACAGVAMAMWYEDNGDYVGLGYCGWGNMYDEGWTPTGHVRCLPDDDSPTGGFWKHSV